MHETILFIVSVLATWRVTYMLLNEAAPFDVFGRFRHLLGVGEYEGTRPEPGSLRQLFSCFKCLSVWVAMPPAFLMCQGDAAYFVGLVLAISAAAILVQDYAEKRGM